MRHSKSSSNGRFDKEWSAVSFKLEAGQTVALVGPTGSGKSTVVRLVYRLYDPMRGSIRLNGQELPSLTQKSMRNIMAMVPQDVVLFNDTIEYNIRYVGSQSSVTVSEEGKKDSTSLLMILRKLS